MVVAATLTCGWLQLGCLAGTANGDTGSFGCANDQLIGFRAFMPDCRAYEQVTPSYKGGAQVLLFVKAIAPDGKSLIGVSYGGFAGTENSEQGALPSGSAVYRLSRSTAGWSAQALEPPATSLSSSSYVTASADVTSTLWQLGEAQGSPSLRSGRAHSALAVRIQGGSPVFESVGPENPQSWPGEGENFRFEGATADLGLVVYGIETRKGATWPGDESTAGRSLYEYRGTGNDEPDLVAVRNQGSLHGTPHVNEGAELIGKCGADLGSVPSASAYNAISSGGGTVLFTVHRCAGAPPVDELYARVDDQQTIALSEPGHPLAQGSGESAEECNAKCEAAAPQRGVFQGASEDGKRVFFTTRQSLLNGDEAGEGSGNDLYEAELEGGALERLRQVSHDSGGAERAEVQGVLRIAETGRRVYYVARGVLAGANGEGASPTPGKDNLYSYDTLTGQTGFVATLAPGDEADWQEADDRPAQASPDGEFLVFPSGERLTGAEDASTVAQLFEYDARSARLSRVSIGQRSGSGYVCPRTGLVQAGFNCDGNTDTPRQEPTIPTPQYSGSDTATETDSTLAVTDDGRVFFMSRDALTPLAVEESKNIYEYSGGNVYLIAAGEDPQLEYGAFQEGVDESGRLVSTDAGGEDVFFGAVGQLVPSDADTQADVYDARAGGGLVPPEPQPGCEAGACRGGSAGPPALSAPSELLTGEEEEGSPPSTTAGPPRKRPAGGLGRARTTRLAHALRRCRSMATGRRRRCEKAARRRYGRASKAVRSR